MLVVVSRVDKGVVRQSESLSLDGAVKRFRAAILEVRAAASADEHGVAREKPRLTSLLEQVAVVGAGAARGEERPK